MEFGEETWDTQKKPPAKAIYFADSQTAIDGLLDDWLPRLIESQASRLQVFISELETEPDYLLRAARYLEE